MAFSDLTKQSQARAGSWSGLALRMEMAVDGQRGCAGVEGVCLL